MSDDPNQKDVIAWDVSEDEIVALVSGIDRAHIIHLVKNSKYLRQHVFRGFRPSRLPWSQVPSRLAREVRDDFQHLEMLVGLWIESNLDLLEKVGDISADRLRESVAELLAHLGVENKLQVLWALVRSVRSKSRRNVRDER